MRLIYHVTLEHFLTAATNSGFVLVFINEILSSYPYFCQHGKFFTCNEIPTLFYYVHVRNIHVRNRFVSNAALITFNGQYMHSMKCIFLLLPTNTFKAGTVNQLSLYCSAILIPCITFATSCLTFSFSKHIPVILCSFLNS